jgi:hypothetical protein
VSARQSETGRAPGNRVVLARGASRNTASRTKCRHRTPSGSATALAGQEVERSSCFGLSGGHALHCLSPSRRSSSKRRRERFPVGLCHRLDGMTFHALSSGSLYILIRLHMPDEQAPTLLLDGAFNAGVRRVWIRMIRFKQSPGVMASANRVRAGRQAKRWPCWTELSDHIGSGPNRMAAR